MSPLPLTYEAALALALQHLRYRHVPRRLDPVELAHDVVVDVLLSGREVSNWTSYVRKAVVNGVCRALRDDSRRRVREREGAGDGLVRDRIDASIDAETILRRDESGLLRRHYIDGETILELAVSEGWGYDMTKQRLRRARGRVR